MAASFSGERYIFRPFESWSERPIFLDLQEGGKKESRETHDGNFTDINRVLWLRRWDAD